LDSRETGRLPLGWKLVIDSTNAPALADFWAAALEYEVEDPSALISQLLAAGHIGLEAVVEYCGRRIFRGYAAIRHPEDPFDETSGIGRGRRLLFQEVPERKSGKNRLHIDVHSEPGGLDELVTRLEKLGQPVYARSMRDLQDAGGSCNTPEAMSSARRKPTSTLQEERSPITGRGPQCITCEVGSCRSRSAHCGRQESRAG
jgi:hypothetical protein